MSTINQPLVVLQVSTLPLLTRLRLRRPSPLTPARSRLLRGRPISVPPIYSSDPTGNPPSSGRSIIKSLIHGFFMSISFQTKHPLCSSTVCVVVDGVVQNVIPFRCDIDVRRIEDFLVHFSTFADAFCNDLSRVVSKQELFKIMIIRIRANKMKGSFKGLNRFEERTSWWALPYSLEHNTSGAVFKYNPNWVFYSNTTPW